MQTTYTQGEWIVTKMFDIITIHNHKTNVADILKVDIDPEEAEANARLIAEAPTMLNALIEAEKLINSIRQYMPKSVQNADRFNFENINANVIKAAIQKATQP